MPLVVRSITALGMAGMAAVTAALNCGATAHYANCAGVVTLINLHKTSQTCSYNFIRFMKVWGRMKVTRRRQLPCIGAVHPFADIDPRLHTVDRSYYCNPAGNVAALHQGTQRSPATNAARTSGAAAPSAKTPPISRTAMRAVSAK